TAQIKVQILPEEAKDEKLTFISSNPNIISVDEYGNIYGIQSGEATIIARAKNGIEGRIDVKVYTKVEDIILGIKDLAIQEGEEYILKPIVLPDDASNKNLSYKVENSEIARIDSSGKILGIKEG